MSALRWLGDHLLDVLLAPADFALWAMERRKGPRPTHCTSCGARQPPPSQRDHPDVLDRCDACYFEETYGAAFRTAVRRAVQG